MFAPPPALISGRGLGNPQAVATDVSILGSNLPTIKSVSAERVPQEAETAEILYVVIPPPTARPAPPTVFQRLHYRLWLMRDSEVFDRIAVMTQSVIGAIGFTIVCCVALYGLYYLKSILGIDLSHEKHLEDFVPIPGYGRW